jgi:Skp family chaperone for outer membrane proteins
MGVLNRAAGIKPGDEGGTEPEPDPDPTPSATAKKEPSIMQTLKQEATKSRLAGKLMGKNLSEGLAEQISDKGPAAARKQLAKIEKTAGKHATKLQKIYNRTSACKAELQRIQDAIDAKDDEQKRKDDALAQELLEKDIARKEEQKRVYQSFLDSVKSIFSGIRDAITGAFDIKNLGGSTNSIIRNMNKLLSKVRDFSKNISQLATLGLDPALLQQVIQAGPVAGARLASALVAGGAGALGEINAGFSQIGSLASEIATTGTQSLFGQGKQETIYNINVSGGVGSGATIGKAIVDAIKDYERTSGAVWQGA